jgi:hypothetical protein
MANATDHWIFASYIQHLESRIGTRLRDTERTNLCEFARGHFEAIDRCNALFHGITRAIHLTEVVLATLEGRWLLGKQVDSAELRHVLIAVWCHSAAFADTLTDDDRLPRGIPNDGWWPWVFDRSATLCAQAAQAMSGIDGAKLVALSQACGFAPVAVGHRSDHQSGHPPDVTKDPDIELVQQLHAAWLISLASDRNQATKLKPLWTALHYWSGESSGVPLELPGTLPEWIHFPRHWKTTLSQWSTDAMTPAMKLLELTEDGQDHLEHLRCALQ